MNIDAKGLILGRVASFAAEQALRGESVTIVNASQVVLAGRPKEIIEKAKKRRELGVVKQGPYIPRKPAGLMRRAVRGMLPYKKPRGKAAYALVKCHDGCPEAIKGELVKMDARFRADKLTTIKRITLGKVCMQVSGPKGGKK